MNCRAETVRRTSVPSSTADSGYSIFSGAQLDLFASTTPAPRVRHAQSVDTHRRARTGTVALNHRLRVKCLCLGADALATSPQRPTESKTVCLMGKAAVGVRVKTQSHPDRGEARIRRVPETRVRF